jgi:hypothetical protein
VNPTGDRDRRNRSAFHQGNFRGGHQEAFAHKRHGKILVDSIRVLTLGAILPQPDDLLGPVAVPGKSDHDRVKWQPGLWFEDVDRHECIFRDVQQNFLADKIAPVDHFNDFRRQVH